jgi:dephospho-CoA kinase
LLSGDNHLGATIFTSPLEMDILAELKGCTRVYKVYRCDSVRVLSAMQRSNLRSQQGLKVAESALPAFNEIAISPAINKSNVSIAAASERMLRWQKRP